MLQKKRMMHPDIIGALASSFLFLTVGPKLLCPELKKGLFYITIINTVHIIRVQNGNNRFVKRAFQDSPMNRIFSLHFFFFFSP